MSRLAETPPQVLAAEGGTLGSIEDWINSVFDPISRALSTFVFAEISVSRFHPGPDVLAGTASG